MANTTTAEAAKQIRKELKKYFPNTKFSVKSSIFAGGDSVSVKWTDGFPAAFVDVVLSKFKYGHFDGMTDMYEMSNCRGDVQQVKYVSTSRSISAEFAQKLIDWLMNDKSNLVLPSGSRVQAEESRSYRGYDIVGPDGEKIDRILAPGRGYTDGHGIVYHLASCFVYDKDGFRKTSPDVEPREEYCTFSSHDEIRKILGITEV